MKLPKQNLELFNVFSIIDLNLHLVFIGMKFTHSHSIGTSIIHQNKSINEELKSFGVLNIKPHITPLSAIVNLVHPMAQP